MVTHDPRTAAFADSMVFLVDGRVTGQMQRPTPEAVVGQWLTWTSSPGQMRHDRAGPCLAAPTNHDVPRVLPVAAADRRVLAGLAWLRNERA
jgi:hypothetical protein